MLIRIRVYVKDKACTEEKIVGQRVATRGFFLCCLFPQSQRSSSTEGEAAASDLKTTDYDAALETDPDTSGCFRHSHCVREQRTTWSST